MIYYVGTSANKQTKNSDPYSVNRNAIPSHSSHQRRKERLTCDALRERCNADELAQMTQRHQEQNAAARGTYKQPEDERRGIIK